MKTESVDTDDARELGTPASYYNSSSSSYIVCPMCKGKGYREEREIMKEKQSNLQSNGVVLPKILTPRILNSQSTNKFQERMAGKLPNLLPNRIGPRSSFHGSCSSLNSQFGRNYRMVKCDSFGDLNLDTDLIGEKEIERPAEYSKIVKTKLISSDWSERLEGLQGAVYLSRVDPEIILEMGREICRKLINELLSLRTRCVRVACQTVRELFKIQGFVFRPEFDEITISLMTRAADSKKTVRDDVDDAITSIANYAPVNHLARAVVRGPQHKHQLVRKSGLKILKALVNRIGVATLMKNLNYREARKTIIQSGCLLLDDPISEIRNGARQVMRPLVLLPEFDDIISQDKNTIWFRRANQALHALKFEIDNN